MQVGTHISFTKEPPYIHISNEWKIGTQVLFTQVAGRVTSRLRIPVRYESGEQSLALS